MLSFFSQTSANEDSDMKERRQSRALRSLARVPPTSAEAKELHENFLKYGQVGPEWSAHASQDRVWMGDTVLEKSQLMFPQERK